MRKHTIFPVLLMAIIIAATLSGCSNYDFSETGTEIISASEAVKRVSDGAVLVDARGGDDFVNKGHVAGAVNIERTAITIQEPYPNLIAPTLQMEQTLQLAGIEREDHLVIYDDNDNMDAARLWWTLKVYGHENVQVISGGMKALAKAGTTIETGASDIKPSNYRIENMNEDLIADLDDVRAQLNEPAADTIFLDVRSKEEFDQGTIPTSVNIDYTQNNYSDGTYRKVTDTQIFYIESGITPSDSLIIFCKTSIRGAQTYLALYNAGYRNLKLYDAAWVEYCSYENLPVQLPEGAPVSGAPQDNS